jgi:hypothetical protein
MALKDQLVAWQAAGIVDAETAARIEAFEASRSPAETSRGGISAGEAIAYIGSVVLLVGVGFLFGTQYKALGSAGRLTILALVVGAGLVMGELVRRAGASLAARRARAAGWAVASIAAAGWFIQAFVEAHILTRPPQQPYPGAADDTSGAIMLGAAIGFVIAAGLLWRAGAGLLGLAAAVLAYSTSAALDAYLRSAPSAWGGEATWLVPAAVLALMAETLARLPDRRWAREILRFTAVLPPALAALVLSNQPDGGSLEYLAGALALAAFGLAYLRRSGGYAIAAGVALFAFVNEVGVRHFAQSVGYPIVLIVSGITLLGVAAGLFRLLPRLRRRPSRPAGPAAAAN